MHKRQEEAIVSPEGSISYKTDKASSLNSVIVDKI